MPLLTLVRSLAREWLIALSAYALLVAPFGCELQSQILNPGGDTTAGGTIDPGLHINEDLSHPLIAAGRAASGDAFYIYGTRQASGSIGEVQSILIRTADGRESFIVFELGRPTYLQGADGSSITIDYTEVGATRLAATVDVYDAVSGTTETVTTDIDLQKTAQDVAATIADLSGLQIDVPVATDVEGLKASARAFGPLMVGLVAASLVVVSQALIIILGQVMEAVYAAVSYAMQIAVMAAFMPIYWFASLLGEVTVSIGAAPLVDVIIEVPTPPHLRS